MRARLRAARSASWCAYMCAYVFMCVYVFMFVCVSLCACVYVRVCMWGACLHKAAS